MEHRTPEPSEDDGVVAYAAPAVETTASPEDLLVWTITTSPVVCL